MYLNLLSLIENHVKSFNKSVLVVLEAQVYDVLIDAPFLEVALLLVLALVNADSKVVHCLLESG